MRNVDSKDMWYFGMASVILSFVVQNPISSLGLLISGLICWLYHRKKKKEELQQERIRDLSNQAESMVNLVGKVFGNMVVEEKPKRTPRRKTPSKRGKRKWKLNQL